MMIQVVLVVHLILAVSIIGLILIQRSEGGGLGIGGSGGMGGFASPSQRPAL
jgi:preprotein translocase subunit SecG